MHNHTFETIILYNIKPKSAKKGVTVVCFHPRSKLLTLALSCPVNLDTYTSLCLVGLGST
jgi:hypothetical protein